MRGEKKPVQREVDWGPVVRLVERVIHLFSNYLSIMWREIRRVPANWQHPIRFLGHSEEEYQPCFQRDLREDIKDYFKELKKWYKDYFDFVENRKIVRFGDKTYSYELWNFSDWIWDEPPNPPDPKYYMPTWERYQLFEDVSEWTPLSPPFEKPEQLVEWLSENLDFWWAKRTKEQAQSMVDRWFVLSWMIVWGKCYDPQEQATL